MSPELINAIKERIQNNHTKESIKAEVLAMGYAYDIFEAAYVLAEHDVHGSAGPELASLAPTTLSSVHVLVKDAWQFACGHLGMVALLGAPLILVAILAELQIHVPTNLALVGALSVVSVVAMLFYFINMLATLYLISRGDGLETSSYKEAFIWTKDNILGMLFVYILTLLAVFGGFLLFIIPGCIALVTLYFSQYVYVIEGKRGMAALMRSRALVKGRWFTVLKKIIGLALYFLLPVFLTALVVGILSAFYPLEQFALVGELAIQVASAFFTIMGTHVMFQLYRELASMTSDVPVKKSVSVKYWLLIGIGFIAIPALIVAAYISIQMSDLKDVMVEPASVEYPSIQLSRLDVVAGEYALNQGTFTGVCAVLETTLESDSSVVCNDSADSWAVSMKDGEDLWCIDSKQVAPKRIQAEIGEETACIVIK